MHHVDMEGVLYFASCVFPYVQRGEAAMEDLRL